MSLLSEYVILNKLIQQRKQVVFYAESRHYYQYFEKLLNDLLENNISICYITSDSKDPLLKLQRKNLEVVYVKWMLGFLFAKIKADVMIMTMPDIGNFLFKRSSGVDTYLYVFHAMVSTHQQYRKEAFYNYDAIFCIGDYQVKEIRLAEELYKQKRKEIVRYGYPLLKKLEGAARVNNEKQTILIAPSWFDGCIFDTCINELVAQLAILSYWIIIRSHPEFEKRKRKSFNSIQKLVSKYDNVTFDTTPNVLDRLPSTDILITDRSGIALEFAFGIRKPVLFIETVLKQTNKDYNQLGIEPIENSLRSEIGVTILPTHLHQLSEKINELNIKSKLGFFEKMETLKNRMLFNNDDCDKNGLDFILKKIKEH